MLLLLRVACVLAGQRARHAAEEIPGASRTPPATFAVYSRVIAAELPYLASFMNHYASLGVVAFYLRTNHPFESEAIDRYMRGVPLPATVLTRRLHAVKDTTGAKGVSDNTGCGIHDPILFAQVQETFVIGVDVDEFWVLPRGMASFDALVTRDPAADMFKAPWVLHTARFQLGRSQLRRQQPQAILHGHSGHAGKWMARRSALLQVCTHKPRLTVNTKRIELHSNRCDPLNQSGAGVILHQWSRSFRDVVNKVLQGLIASAAQASYHEPALCLLHTT